jgi:ADP-ribose pyrophosphatase YjhB (NUDIX family)
VAQEPFRGFAGPRRDYIGVFGWWETPEGLLLVANRRRIGGRETTTWDLPGGGVEEGETLEEALRREMAEETALDVAVGEMLFVAEGERIHGGRRTGVWRSFFFRVERLGGAVDHGRETDIVGHRFEPLPTLPPLLTAPYHRGFLAWLASGRTVRHVFDRWID